MNTVTSHPTGPSGYALRLASRAVGLRSRLPARWWPACRPTSCALVTRGLGERRPVRRNPGVPKRYLVAATTDVVLVPVAPTPEQFATSRPRLGGAIWCELSCAALGTAPRRRHRSDYRAATAYCHTLCADRTGLDGEAVRNGKRKRRAGKYPSGRAAAGVAGCSSPCSVAAAPGALLRLMGNIGSSELPEL
jgi:hypothetical protein